MPIPQNAVKELLSRNFVRLAAAQTGFIPAQTELDFGVDLHLQHVELLEEQGHARFCPSGFGIDVQVKATTDASVVFSDADVMYDLSASTYNALVRRVRANNTIPLVLALFILPDNVDEWIELEESALVLRRCGYLWRPEPREGEVANTATKRITIPRTQRINLSSFEALRQECEG